MGAVSLSSLSRLAGLGPLAARVMVGVIIAAHGVQKLLAGPGILAGPVNLGGNFAQLGAPAPTLMAYVVAFAEIIGGIVLIVGLLSRLSALLLTIQLVSAVLLFKTSVGFLSPMDGPGVGAELELALIAGLLAVMFAGPGRFSLDNALGIERAPEDGRTRSGARQASTI